MRLQTLYLPSVGRESGVAFAIVADQAPADLSPAEVEAVHRFGRDLGAAGVLVTARTVDIPVELELGTDGTGEAPAEAFAHVDEPSLGAAVARAVRTYFETQSGTLRRGG